MTKIGMTSKPTLEKTATNMVFAKSVAGQTKIQLIAKLGIGSGLDKLRLTLIVNINF